MFVYGILIIVSLELLVRIFHLYNERPERYVNQMGIQTWVPGQEGYSVYGNRRQIFTKYHINQSGYNSYREFNPVEDECTVALVGDSFIEGFHQDYNNSIGKKIENLMENKVEVYEYGHSSNDFADQLQLIDTYKDKFELIDFIVLGLKFENDLTRSEYKLIERKPVLPILSYSKLYLYMQTIGFLDPLKNKAYSLKEFIQNPGGKPKKSKKVKEDMFPEYLKNFQLLIKNYGYDHSKMVLLLDSRITDIRFMHYLDSNGFEYIDFAKEFEKTKLPTTLIYDRHWNNHGRSIIAKIIAEYLKSSKVCS